MIKLPQQNRWVQNNRSDKYNPNAFGLLDLTKNINFDEEGYLKLSPRTVTIIDEAENGDFGVPLAIGKVSETEFIVATSSNANFNISIPTTTLTCAENDGTAEPTLTSDSYAVYFNDKWVATTATGMFYRDISSDDSATWTDTSITATTSGVKHILEVFRSRNQLCISNGNTVREYNTAFSLQVTLTIPADFEIVGMAYNNYKMGIITRPATASANTNAFLFIWDGSSTTAGQGVDIGSESAISITAYKASFVVLTRSGKLLYFNGGGFDTLDEFPFYNDGYQLGLSTSDVAFGENMIVDDDKILVHVGFTFQSIGRKKELFDYYNPSGVWCYDPLVGLHHKYSPSISKAYNFGVTDANVNTTTDVMTVSSGTLPATGSIVRYIAGTTEIGGLTLQNDYYLIKTATTTFKLATTKEYALQGIAIDLTSVGSGGNNYFYMYDLKDYSATFYDDAGALGKIGGTSTYYQDIFIGGDFDTTALASNDSLCMVVPFLENRGYFQTLKFFSEEIRDSSNHLLIKFKPLGDNDSIVVKSRYEDVIGIPVATLTSATWDGTNTLHATHDFSEAKTYFDAGGELELEIVSGAGAGTISKITDIGSGSGVYSFSLEDNVLGAASTLSCHFVINNFAHATTITSANNNDGYVLVPINTTGKFIQFKIELRGSDVTIEEMNFINKEFQKML